MQEEMLEEIIDLMEELSDRQLQFVLRVINLLPLAIEKDNKKNNRKREDKKKDSE